MKQSLFGLETYNVLFITLDCCRFDTFDKAKLPFVKSLSDYAQAKTHGTYTLPSHMSFFMGYLPIVIDSPLPYYSPDIRQLWRLKSGRKRSLETVGILLDGSNIFEGYRKLGFTVIGTGGVRWFMNKTLSSLFDTFLFYGPDDKTSVFVERKKKHFSLSHLDSLIEKINRKKKYFLFINVSETHVPYDFGEGILSEEIRNIIGKASPIWGCKKNNLKNVEVSQDELRKLHRAQIKALESVDGKIKRLVQFLPKPLLVVITGDHGECFGEDMNWGHGYPLPKVMEVPLLISPLSK